MARRPTGGESNCQQLTPAAWSLASLRVELKLIRRPVREEASIARRGWGRWLEPVEAGKTDSCLHRDTEPVWSPGGEPPVFDEEKCLKDLSSEVFKRFGVLHHDPA